MDILEEEEQLVIYGSDKYKLLNKDCDNILSCNNKRKKPSVIDISDTYSNGLFKQKSANAARKRKLEENRNRSRNIFTISHKPKSLDADKYLKISPIKNQLCERRLSSKSINRDIYKEYSDTAPEYNSLPFIKVEDSSFSKRNTASSRSQNRKNSSGPLLRKKVENHFVLPPIVTSSQFRSISATPRQGNKTFSALSMKFEGNFKDEKSRKFSMSVKENPLSNR
ncbi:hypothetical protein NQ314_017091 [Rhamnusium bicolor]|uniref:Uncharacterized protein n=1 Tax=Rhamnusium bicolor TaxID=1586634 RepID=A0AAV8WV47_9CUCU|nr:hypothetical protein NQ314_017091 [Rhamnusium bicolor]